MKHLDLFSGIGGFSLALDRVWHEEKNEHIFIEWDDFCTAVLQKHWPEAEYHKDIRRFVADTNSGKPTRNKGEILEAEEVSGIYRETLRSRGTSGTHTNDEQSTRVDILTGGFPCQPFSQAGRRKGTEDDRYLWPAMLDCITLFKPRWVIAENVSGLATWNDGLVFETVCSDMEKEGYEVQPFRIPACAVGAPHRRDRWWFVANRNCKRRSSHTSECREENPVWSTNRPRNEDSVTPYSISTGTRSAHRGVLRNSEQRREESSKRKGNEVRSDLTDGSTPSWNWNENWIEVATRLCRVDDGIPRRLDRNPRLKALGNAIVPQVAEEIMIAIKQVDIP